MGHLKKTKLQCGWVIFVLAFLLVTPMSCFRNDDGQSQIEVETTEEALSYGITLYELDGDFRNVTASYQDIWNATTSYCSKLYSQRFLGMPWTYIEYWRYYCAADIFTEIAHGTKQANISITPEWVPEDAYGDDHDSIFSDDDRREIFDHLGDDFNDLSPVTLSDNDIVRAEFSFLETPEQRSEMLHLALITYEHAIEEIMWILNDKYDSRRDMYLDAVDEWFGEDDNSDPDGFNIMTQTFQTLTSLMIELANIKQTVAEDMLAAGAANRDEWTSEDYGRIPALRQVIGTLIKIDDEVEPGDDEWSDAWSPADMAFFPDNWHLPQMSNQLKSAISMIDRYLLTPTDGDISEYMGGLEQGDTDNMVDAANNTPFCPDQNCYFSITELVQAYGTTEGMLDEAVKYMYAHMNAFPRLPSEGKAPRAHWGSRYVNKPVSYYSRNFDQNFYDDFGLKAKPYDTENLVKVQKVGIVAIAEYWYNRLVVERGTFEPLEDSDFPRGEIPEGYADVEASIPEYLGEAIKVLRNVLGEKRIKYLVKPILGGSVGLDYLQFLNPELSEDSSLEHIRLIPVYTIDEGTVFELKNLACAHIQHEDEHPNCPDVAFNLLLDQTCTSTDDSVCISSASTILPNSPEEDVSYWIVEHKTSIDVELGNWNPIGVINVKDLGPVLAGSESTPKWMYFDGEAARFASKIGTMRFDSVTDPSCNPINGLDTECLRNWVPAIDNEVVDPSGGQYETSYVTYLELARTAATKAADMREELMTDIITEAQGELLSAAQLDRAMDNYISEIRQICGDNIEPNFEQWVEEAVANDDGPEAFEIFLTERLNNSYGCEVLSNQYVENPSSEDNSSKSGPIHCSVPRRCSLNPATTLGHLGVFGGTPGHSNWGLEIAKGAYTLSEEGENAHIESNDLNRVYGIPRGADTGDDAGDSKPPVYEPIPAEYFCSAEYLTAAQIMDPTNNGIFDFPSSGGGGDVTQNEVLAGMTRIACWAREYQALVKWLISKENIYYLPELFGVPGEIDLINGEIESPEISSYGQYFTRLNEMGKTINDIRTAAEAYVLEFEVIIAKTNTIRDSIKYAENQLDQQQLQIAWQLETDALNSGRYEANMMDQTQNCINGINSDYDLGGKTVGDFITMLKVLEERMLDVGVHSFSDAKNKTKFITSCENYTGDNLIINEYGDWICRYLADQYLGPYWSEFDDELDSISSWIAFGRNEVDDLELISLVPRSEMPSSLNNYFRYPSWYECTQIFEDWVGTENPVAQGLIEKSMFTIACKRKESEIWKLFEIDREWRFAPDEFRCSIPEHTDTAGNTVPEQTTERNYGRISELCANEYYYTTVDYSSRNKLAKEIRGQLLINEYIDKCNEEYGCTISPEGEIEGCTGAMSEDYQDHAAWVEGWEEDMGLLLENAAFLNAMVNNNQFIEQFITSARALAASKNSVSNLVRSIATQIGQLSQLEEDQVSLFKNFINEKNVADASSLSSVAEWNERYDFRRKQYKKQLKRARVAAWIARRAIEFRFGINLSTEYMDTIFGEAPSEWADEIYNTYTSECGETPDDESGTGITGCIAPEERIEDYVQNLEDYVTSYGNTPGQDWWFHEDDDTGVISLRDHIAVNHIEPSKSTGNLLFFSEEMDMDYDAMIDEYSDIAVDLTDPNNDWASPYWDGSGTKTGTWEVTGPLTFLADDYENPVLGLPTEILNAHFTNEWGLFADQMDDFNAEILVSDPGNDVTISQTIYNDEAETDMGSLTQTIVHFPGQYNEWIEIIPTSAFATYLRKNPVQIDDDCASGETYFPGIGRCGVECTDDDTLCETDQVCMNAGMIRDIDTNNLRDAYMCDWCSADRECLYSGIAAVELGIVQTQQDGTVATFKTKVPVDLYWDKHSVNTVEHMVSSVTSAGENSTEVYIKNTTTKNLVATSESGLHQNPPAGYGTAPDGTMSAENINDPLGEHEIDVVAATIPSADAGVQRRKFAASIWLSAESGGSGTGTVSLSIDSETFLKEIQISDTWRRYEIGGIVDYTSVASVSLSVDMNVDVVNILAWGAQIEDGTTKAGPYIPTGKNLISDSADFSAWYGSAISQPSDDPGPTGTGDVHSFADEVGSWASASIDVNIEGGYQVGDMYTFSVWLKSGSGLEQDVRIWMYQYSGSVVVDSDRTPAGTVVDDTWRRYDISTSSTGIVDSSVTHFKLKIVPAPYDDTNTGEVLAWGPQLEKGTIATGYQETRAGLDPSVRDWGMDFGVVGTQYTPISTYPCDDYGNVWLNYDVCIEDAGEQIETCCYAAEWDLSDDQTPWDSYTACVACAPTNSCTFLAHQECEPETICNGYDDDQNNLNTCPHSPPGYVRNTYLREHYDSGFEVESVTGSDYPLPDELYASLSEDSRKEIFKGQWQYVPAGSDGQPGYYVYRFHIDINSIEDGTVGQFGLIALNNFNYRMRTVAANVVGINVMDFENGTDASNPWLVYDLKQMGNVRIRNHHEEFSLEEFDIPTGRISGGQAWAAEQVIGFPISSAHQSALAQLTRTALMGRPMQGSFELRLYDTDELVWNNIDDIQLILGYHYWTRSE
ncbi:MAG: hypothetical protein GY847_41870 [Proteobacteria bacterium]|nr:hypothetical protein [Pseudomonadota bacterium]